MLSAGILGFAILVGAKATASGHHDPQVLAAAALLAAVVVWVIWYVPPSWSLSAALALGVFGSNWGNLGLPSSVAPDRSVLGFTLLAIALRAPGSRDRVKIPWRPLYGLMFVAGAYSVASAINSGAIQSHTDIFLLIDRIQLFGWLVFVIAPVAFTTEADRRVLLGTMVALGVYLGLTTCFEILGPRSLVFPRYINNPALGIQYGRGRGPFLDATLNGVALYACLLASLIATMRWERRWTRVIARVTIAICTLALLLTFQRTVWVGVVASAAITLILTPGLRRFLIVSAVAVAIVVGLAFVAVPSVREHATSRAQDSQTVENREALDAAAFSMLEHKPLFGYGFGQFSKYAPNFYVTSDSYSLWDQPPLPVHDIYLAVAVDLGLSGSVPWLVILLVGVGGVALRRRGPPETLHWRIALAALLTMWLVAGITSPFGGSFVSLVLWLPAAAIVGAEIGERVPETSPSAPLSAPLPAV